MPLASQKSASPLLVFIAFATVYMVWGSTYFFIKVAVNGGFPPFLLGALRFFIAGFLMMVYCVIKGENIFVKQNIISASVSGVLLLFCGIGSVIWVEQTLPSGMVAIMVSSPPIWFVLLDKKNWGENFKSKATIAGLIIGFAGVILLFSEQLGNIFSGGSSSSKLPGLLLLFIGTFGWAAGSLYSKYKLTTGSAAVNTSWQMLAAGCVFIIASSFHHEFNGLQLQTIPFKSWFALSYLILLGSIAAFSAYVWLLQVRPATQVGTYAYVNPVIAIILGVIFANENISLVQIIGLAVILGSVLLINLSKYRKEKQVKLVELADCKA
jgi:drug/metabolite transporter (DMT)-like permease